MRNVEVVGTSRNWIYLLRGDLRCVWFPHFLANTQRSSQSIFVGHLVVGSPELCKNYIDFVRRRSYQHDFAIYSPCSFLLTLLDILLGFPKTEHREGCCCHPKELQKTPRESSARKIGCNYPVNRLYLARKRQQCVKERIFLLQMHLYFYWTSHNLSRGVGGGGVGCTQFLAVSRHKIYWLAVNLNSIFFI